MAFFYPYMGVWSFLFDFWFVVEGPSWKQIPPTCLNHTGRAELPLFVPITSYRASAAVWIDSYFPLLREIELESSVN